MPPPPTQDSQCRLASTAASFSSTGLSPHDLLSHVPQAVSPQSSADLAWVCSTTAALQLPAAGPSRGPLALSGVCMAVERIVCVILIQFRPSRIICFTFSLKCFPSDPNNCPTVGTVPPPTEGRSSPTNSPLLPPTSFILPSFPLFYIFFSAGQVLLSTLSWYSASTSVSEGAFLMYLWREMYYTSNYSTILFSLQRNFLIGAYFQIHGLNVVFNAI